MSGRSVVFYYDVVCPFAYMASRLVEALGRRTGAQVVWKPVLLGEAPGQASGAPVIPTISDQRSVIS